ncbi:NosD domain-containing protein [Methanohalophilus halophilus]|uniref:Copper-binding protein n=1 Tax=Methanohalophilus halophilus TaxID=2177 RepID=A0A1L3Q0X0_9EURY|nr:NosD domain-containing protein [Methanohalophilus halophilus]APH38510.1 copper-binding protein [Methanohalophilus halophilus]RNI10612.1 VPXXXP-CTERM sorting domain-containing protein [Methanohalophilus halophilus]SDW11588.1 VPXXXP-CTERM protein sorting domain-containing protein [Methanohalophilus halophilus]
MKENVDLHRFWILLASAVVLVLLSSLSLAAEITVDDDGAEDYTTIQEAVNAANNSGDTILVYPGTYNQNVDVAKELNITSVGGASVTNITSDFDYVLFINSDNVTINGFNVSGTVGGNTAGIYLNDANHCNLNSNIVTNIMTNAGIYLASSENNNLSNNIVFGNNYGIYLRDNSNNNNLTGNDASENLGFGIYLESSGNTELIDNTILDNFGNGIYLISSENNNLTHNNISGNGANGIYMSGANNNNLTSNIVQDNDEYGIWATGNTNLITNNTISNNGYSGVYLQDCTFHTLSDNTITGNGEDSGSGYGIDLWDSNNNHIFNNYLNNSKNANIDYSSVSNLGNNWNTTNKTGPNIIGGPYIGGNFWATPDGTGFSQVNADINGDGFCDTPNDTYTIREGYEQYDYLPLASTSDDNEPPVVIPIAPLEKEVGPGELLELNVSVTDDSDISSVVVNVSSVNDTVDKALLSNVNGYWINNSITLDVNPHGMYNLNINATDEFGNSNTSMNLSVIGESTSTGDGNEDEDGNFVYHPQPLFDVPTGNPLLLVGVLGIVVIFFMRRRE